MRLPHSLWELAIKILFLKIILRNLKGLFYFGPPKTRAGSMMTALNNSRTAFTEMPRMRNGMRRSQTMGYNSNASSARGQQITNKINQSKNLTTFVLHT
jgi:hypothetical protein